MRLLLVEDDVVIADGLQVIFKNAGYVVDWSTSIAAAEIAVESSEFDALIIDRHLPDGDGVSLVAQLRAAHNQTPILLLTAQQKSSQKAEGLNLGADDYLGKPFDMDELLARVKALIRRRAKPLQTAPITIGSLNIDPNSQTVVVSGKNIELSPKEYLLLEYLCLHLGQAVDRVTLLEHVWGETADLFSNSVDVHISNLRKKIDSPKKESLIKTVKGKGYLLCRPSI